MPHFHLDQLTRIHRWPKGVDRSDSNLGFTHSLLMRPLNTEGGKGSAGWRSHAGKRATAILGMLEHGQDARGTSR
jgi:hypothetical protein